MIVLVIITVAVPIFFVILSIKEYLRLTSKFESEITELHSLNRIKDLGIQEKDFEIQELKDKLESFGNLVTTLEEIQQR